MFSAPYSPYGLSKALYNINAFYMDTGKNNDNLGKCKTKQVSFKLTFEDIKVCLTAQFSCENIVPQSGSLDTDGPVCECLVRGKRNTQKSVSPHMTY